MRDRPRRCAFVSLIFALALAAVPATAAEGRRDRVRSWAEIRQHEVVIQKWDLSCGAAALATLLTYDFADPVGEREIAMTMLRRAGPARVHTRGGFSLLDMQEFAEARGYQADGYGEMTLDELRLMLPAIVPVEFHGYDHFVVVRRIGPGTVFFADPAYGRRTVPLAKFEAAWKSRIAFVLAQR